MKLHWLEYFYAINKWGSFRRAAKELNISQSSISQSIQKLESTLGVSLFERTNTGISMTEAGKIVFQKATIIFDALEEMKEEVRTSAAEEKQSIRLAFCYCDDLAIKISTAFARAYPQYNLDIKQRNYSSIISNLDNNEFDICITFPELATEKHKVIPFGNLEFSVFASAGHPFREKKVLTPQELQGQTVVFPMADTSVETHFRRYCEENGIKYYIDRHSWASDLQISAVMIGYMDDVTILPTSLQSYSNTVCVRQLNPPLYMDLSIVLCKDKVLDKPLDTMLHFLVNHQW